MARAAGGLALVLLALLCLVYPGPGCSLIIGDLPLPPDLAGPPDMAPRVDLSFQSAGPDLAADMTVDMAVPGDQGRSD